MRTKDQKSKTRKHAQIIHEGDIIQVSQLSEQTGSITKTISNAPHTPHATIQNVNKYNKTKKQDKLIQSEVTDDKSYNHFKSLLPKSTDLCKGIIPSGAKYKVHIALSKDFASLKKTNHYRIIYIHDNHRIHAYISVKLYKKDGGFMFIHKVCSTGGGHGTKLMNIILEDAKKNHESLGITYLSLTTHNLELVQYYNQFAPTRVVEIDNPGSKAKVLKRVAYIVWQLSPKMPWFDYK
jgi:hypothetical protein